MRFSPFVTMLLLMLGLMACGIMLPALGFSQHATVLVCLWALVFMLTLIVMGVTRISMQFFGPAFCHGRRHVSDEHPPKIALTFDDGPDIAATPALLKLLAEHHIHATFFCVGQAVRQHPELARQMIEAGHQVENHTDTHAWSLNFALNKRWRQELHAANEAIEQATGQRPRYMRPPMGLTNPHLYTELRKTNLLMVGWDVRSFDTLGKPVAKVIDRVVKQTRPGSIILLHDGKQDPARVCEITQGIINALNNKGFSFVTVDEMRSGHDSK